MLAMTDAAAPPALGVFEGEPVLQSSIVIPNAGGGLREAMKVDPALWHKGDVVNLVLQCVVTDVSFKGIKGLSVGWNRVHRFDAETATVVDEAIVGAQLAEQKRRIREAAGEFELPLDGLADLDKAAAEGIAAALGVAGCICAHPSEEHPDGGPCLVCADDPDETEPCESFDPAVAEVPA